jgi:hypothetical protein
MARAIYWLDMMVIKEYWASGFAGRKLLSHWLGGKDVMARTGDCDEKIEWLSRLGCVGFGRQIRRRIKGCLFEALLGQRHS